MAQSFPLAASEPKISSNAAPISPIRSAVIILRPFRSKARFDVVRVTKEPPIAARKGRCETEMPAFSGVPCAAQAPSSKHLPQARNVPTVPDSTSPCPPHRFSPPRTSTVAVCGSDSGDEGWTAIRSSAPFCRTVTPPKLSETSCARLEGSVEGSIPCQCVNVSMCQYSEN